MLNRFAGAGQVAYPGGHEQPGVGAAVAAGLPVDVHSGSKELARAHAPWLDGCCEVLAESGEELQLLVSSLCNRLAIILAGKPGHLAMGQLHEHGTQRLAKHRS